jgi:ATP-dependent Clp protease adaptor protein ClpS
MSRTGPHASIETDEQTDTSNETSLARPWNVIVHDDPVTPMAYVVQVFMQVFRYQQPKAQRLMLEVHNTGRSVVWTGERETAEVYVQKLHARHLLATLEQVGVD